MPACACSPANRLDADGRLVVTSQATRNQARNLEDARARVADLLRAALVAAATARAHQADGGRAPAAAGREEAAGNGEALARPARRRRLS